MIDTRALDRWIAMQEGIVCRRQCLEHGITDDRLHRLLTSGRWRALHPGVYATFTGRVPPQGAMWAAVLAAGEDARLTHESALWAERPSRMPPAIPDVGISFGRPRLVVPGVRITRLRHLPRPSGLPPRTRPARSLLDACERLEEKEVVHLVCQVIGDMMTTPERVAGELGRRARHRHRQLLTTLLGEVQLGAQSPLELLDLRNDRAHGLPTGQRQVSVRGVGGELRRLDVVVRGVVGTRTVTLVKELDGRLGHEGAGRFRDMHRDNEAALRGGVTLRLGWVDLAGEPCPAAALQTLFWRRAGVGAGHVCRAPGCRLEQRVAALARELPSSSRSA